MSFEEWIEKYDWKKKRNLKGEVMGKKNCYHLNDV